MTRAEEWASQGWQRQVTCDEPRLSEMAGAYREIGLEVQIEPFHQEPRCAGSRPDAPFLNTLIKREQRKR
jgi:hypothetical protein